MRIKGQEMTVARPGHKFIIICTLPSGAKFAVAEHEGMLALSPIEDGIVRGSIAWDTSTECIDFLKKFRKDNGEENWKKFRKLNLEIGEIKIAQ